MQLHKRKVFIFQPIPPNENTTLPFASLRQKERDNREWEAEDSYWADLWDLGHGGGKTELVCSFPKEMKILVSGQRRAVSIRLR